MDRPPGGFYLVGGSKTASFSKYADEIPWGSGLLGVVMCEDRSGKSDFKRMKLHRIPFEYWDDEHTKVLRETKPPEFLDPDYYVEAHWIWDRNGYGPYFMNKRCRKYFRQFGPFDGRYIDGDYFVDRFKHSTAYIVAPGPSLEQASQHVDLKNKIVFVLNSAGFKVAPGEYTYWVMAESSYADWLKVQLVRHKEPMWERIQKHPVVATGRVAMVLRAWEESQKKTFFKNIYVIRWEEGKVVPPRTPAVSAMNALVTAWQAGCKRVYLLGLDLDKIDGKPYASGLPHTREGAANPFDDQIKAIQQFDLPDFEIINCSPYSKFSLPFKWLAYQDLGILQRAGKE